MKYSKFKCLARDTTNVELPLHGVRWDGRLIENADGLPGDGWIAPYLLVRVAKRTNNGPRNTVDEGLTLKKSLGVELRGILRNLGRRLEATAGPLTAAGPLGFV